MSVFKKNRFKILCGILLLAGAIILTIINVISNKGVKITEWDSYYNENNIVFFYEDSNNEKINLLNSTYNIQDQVKDCETEFDKVLKAIDIERNIIKIDDINNTGLNNGYDILSRKTQSNKASFKDAAIISRDFINSLGIKSRIGIFRKGNTKYYSDIEYYVLEYWSTQYNKWIMIDFKDGGYFEDIDDNKLSAIEVMNSDIKKISYMGNTAQLDYKNNISKYFDSYILSIENSSEKKRSNCNVAYIKNDEAVEYKIKNTFLAPTIFTKETKLFEKSPFNILIGSDEKAYLLVWGAIPHDNDEEAQEKKVYEKDNKEKDVYIGAFKDDKVLKNFYLNINDQGYEEVHDNKELELKKGKNTVELSLDGETLMARVTIEKK